MAKASDARAGKAAAPAIEVRPLERTDWAVVEELFGERGACGGCWCMLWRAPRGGRAFEEQKGEPNRAAFRALVEAGQVHGILAFAAGRPVGWCSFGPAASFPGLLRSRVLARPRSAGTWSVTCFFIARGWRGRGVGTRLLQAAVARAFALDAAEVEGFPAVPRSGGQLPGPFAWTGVPALFEAAGFTAEPDPPGARPHYVRKAPRRRVR